MHANIKEGIACKQQGVGPHVGVFGYGRISTPPFPYALIAPPTKSPPLDMFTGECGACYEIACRGAPVMRNAVPTDICSQQSVIVQVTDACPCGTLTRGAGSTHEAIHIPGHRQGGGRGGGRALFQSHTLRTVPGSARPV